MESPDHATSPTKSSNLIHSSPSLTLCRHRGASHAADNTLGKATTATTCPTASPQARHRPALACHGRCCSMLAAADEALPDDDGDEAPPSNDGADGDGSGHNDGDSSSGRRRRQLHLHRRAWQLQRQAANMAAAVGGVLRGRGFFVDRWGVALSSSAGLLRRQ
ncbi:hypothetical protein Dimus_021255 [Dionaea muscipula]